MSLGTEFAALAQEFVEDDDFGSLVAWTRRVLTNQPDGTVTEGTPTTYELRGCVLGAKLLQLGGDSGDVRADAAVFLATAVLPWAADPVSGELTAQLLDTVELQPGSVYRVLKVRTLYAPGGAARPRVIGHVAYLAA